MHPPTRACGPHPPHTALTGACAWPSPQRPGVCRGNGHPLSKRIKRTWISLGSNPMVKNGLLYGKLGGGGIGPGNAFYGVCTQAHPCPSQAENTEISIRTPSTASQCTQAPSCSGDAIAYQLRVDCACLGVWRGREEAAHGAQSALA